MAHEIALAQPVGVPTSAARFVLGSYAHRAAIARIAREFRAFCMSTGMSSAIVGVARFCTVVGRLDKASKRK